MIRSKIGAPTQPAPRLPPPPRLRRTSRRASQAVRQAHGLTLFFLILRRGRRFQRLLAATATCRPRCNGEPTPSARLTRADWAGRAGRPRGIACRRRGRGWTVAGWLRGSLESRCGFSVPAARGRASPASWCRAEPGSGAGDRNVPSSSRHRAPDRGRGSAGAICRPPPGQRNAGRAADDPEDGLGSEREDRPGQKKHWGIRRTAGALIQRTGAASFRSL